LRTLESRRLGARRADDCPAHCQAPAEHTAVDLTVSVTLPTREWTVIDVREPHEVAIDPLPGLSRPIPLGQLLDNPEQLPTGHRYLCVCAKGQRSLAAAKALQRVGREAASLSGGYTA